MTVNVVEHIAELREMLDAERAKGGRVGFVPTMGYLHAGHASLMKRARAENEVVLVSIFVNPLQFGPTEDFAAYPRDLDKDLGVCEEEGVDVVFHPSVDEMYPAPTEVTVSAGEIGTILEGKTRPGHFDGVATVVSKLFNIAGPCRAYFGKKDAQQLVVIKRLARSLNFPVDVLGCETVREADGLAMSSRNVYLTDEQRRAATVLKKALDAGARLIADGERSSAKVRETMQATIQAEPLAELDYAVCVDQNNLVEAAEVDGPVLLAVAARIGKARLIDNMDVNPASPKGARTGTSTAEASIKKG